MSRQPRRRGLVGAPRGRPAPVGPRSAGEEGQHVGSGAAARPRAGPPRRAPGEQRGQAVVRVGVVGPVDGAPGERAVAVSQAAKPSRAAGGASSRCGGARRTTSRHRSTWRAGVGVVHLGPGHVAHLDRRRSSDQQPGHVGVVQPARRSARCRGHPLPHPAALVTRCRQRGRPSGPSSSPIAARWPPPRSPRPPRARPGRRRGTRRARARLPSTTALDDGLRGERVRAHVVRRAPGPPPSQPTARTSGRRRRGPRTSSSTPPRRSSRPRSRSLGDGLGQRRRRRCRRPAATGSTPVPCGRRRAGRPTSASRSYRVGRAGRRGRGTASGRRAEGEQHDGVARGGSRGSTGRARAGRSGRRGPRQRPGVVGHGTDPRVRRGPARPAPSAAVDDARRDVTCGRNSACRRPAAA